MSPSLEPIAGKVIFETPLYQVEIGYLHLDPFTGMAGYLVRNRRTWVVEGETNMELAAVNAAKDLTESLQEHLDEEGSFSDAVSRLKNQE